MILIGLGANLPGAFGAPAEAIEAALAALDRAPCRLVARSRLYESPPWPQPSDQPWYVNAVARIETALAPEALLDRLHAIEREFGRERGARNAARTLDLDLLDFDGIARAGAPTLPHPRLTERAFVLRPLRDVAPDWRHPADGRTLPQLLAALPPDTVCRPLASTP
ncbi:MAG: 2-amino-4-hydroxy-6-hydroxymethyldihydropteridine diphosphokinase [Tagaea sp.]|nr:2-amino-4-hydroxy-6-hydroxymethyldihydropteridine diphosphokinase [Tagaea sp.]